MINTDRGDGEGDYTQSDPRQHTYNTGVEPLFPNTDVSMEEGLTATTLAASLASLTRVNSTNVQDEGLRIGGIGRRMNSKVKISQSRRILRINVVVNLAYSQSVPDRPLLAPIYRWPCLKGPVGSDTYYNTDI
jgi:hypothetical protein